MNGHRSKTSYVSNLLDSAINSYVPSPDLYQLTVVGIQETYWRASNLIVECSHAPNRLIQTIGSSASSAEAW